MPETSTLDNTVLANLTPEERRRSAVYLNDTPAPAGHATIAGQPIEIDHSYVVAFIDRHPGANWMHPCRYLVINPSDQRCMSLESNRPPVFGPLPSGWRLIQRSPDVQDWQLLKIAEGTCNDRAG
jgi:hypothetical protein